MREESINDHISAGMRTPNGDYERPIPGTKLFWTQPGKFDLKWAKRCRLVIIHLL